MKKLPSVSGHADVAAGSVHGLEGNLVGVAVQGRDQTEDATSNLENGVPGAGNRPELASARLGLDLR